MAQEVECKIMGMTVEEFLHLTALQNLYFGIDLEMIVTDTYWELPSDNLLRCRRCRIKDSHEDFFDLTVKGAEENKGTDVSSRSEIILELRRSVEPEDIEQFLTLIGAEKKYTVKKERTLIYNSNDDYGHWADSRNVMIHHDKLIDGSLDAQEWIEIESGSGSEADLKDIILELGIDWDRVSNKSTLDIMGAAEEG